MGAVSSIGRETRKSPAGISTTPPPFPMAMPGSPSTADWIAAQSISSPKSTRAERRADEEGPLYTNAVRNSSDRESRSGSRRVTLAESALEHNALESLDSLTIAFTNHHVHTNGIAGLKFLDGVARRGVDQRSCFDHGNTSVQTGDSSRRRVLGHGGLISLEIPSRGTRATAN